MFTFNDFLSVARKNPYAFVAPVAVVFVLGMTVLETTGVLPFTGQATPSYGSMPMPSVKKLPTARVTSSKSSRQIVRKASSAVKVHGAAGSSSRRKVR
jgi:hypothetical protein